LLRHTHIFTYDES